MKFAINIVFIYLDYLCIINKNGLKGPKVLVKECKVLKDGTSFILVHFLFAVCKGFDGIVEIWMYGAR
jgi:hypothetical protein